MRSSSEKRVVLAVLLSLNILASAAGDAMPAASDRGTSSSAFGTDAQFREYSLWDALAIAGVAGADTAGRVEAAVRLGSELVELWRDVCMPGVDDPLAWPWLDDRACDGATGGRDPGCIGRGAATWLIEAKPLIDGGGRESRG